MTTATTNAPVDEIRDDAARHFWPHSKAAGDMQQSSGLQLVTGGEGVWVNDVEGNRWFDTLSGLWLVNIGHGRREIADAVHHQMLQQLLAARHGQPSHGHIVESTRQHELGP